MQKGDRVVVFGPIWRDTLFDGSVGTVLFVQGNIAGQTALVEFDYTVEYGHNGDGGFGGSPLGLYPHCLWMGNSEVAVIGAYSEHSDVQIGQFIRHGVHSIGLVKRIDEGAGGSLPPSLLIEFKRTVPNGHSGGNGWGLAGHCLWQSRSSCVRVGRHIGSPSTTVAWSRTESDEQIAQHREDTRRREERGMRMPEVNGWRRESWNTVWHSTSGTISDTQSGTTTFKCGVCKKDVATSFQFPATTALLKKLTDWAEEEVKCICGDCMSRFETCYHCKKIFLINKGRTGLLRKKSVGMLLVVSSREGVKKICPKCQEHLSGRFRRCDNCSRLIYPGTERLTGEQVLCPRCHYEEAIGGGWDSQIGASGYKSFPSAGSKTLPPRKYGVEVEAIRASSTHRVNRKEMRPWVRYDDHSLSDGGEEFASPVFFGESGLKEIDRLLEVLKREKYKVNDTCAVHCHVYARGNFTFRDIKRFLAFMWDYEPIIYSILRKPCKGGVTRLCRHVSRERLIKSKTWAALKRTLYGSMGPFDARNKWSNVRYRGMNVHSFFFRGTFEFRYLGATIDPEEIRNFVRLCLYCVENGRLYPQRLLRIPVKPTLRDMKKLLGLPVDLHHYFKKAQIRYDGTRKRTRKEEER